MNFAKRTIVEQSTKVGCHGCMLDSGEGVVQEKLGNIEGKTVVYVGDGNNIVHSWLRLARRLPFRCAPISIPCYTNDSNTAQPFPVVLTAGRPAPWSVNLPSTGRLTLPSGSERGLFCFAGLYAVALRALSLMLRQ